MSIIKPLNIMSRSTLYKPMRMQSNHFCKRNKGFTLLEALIGFLILSVGMLGIASLQAVSLKAGKSAVYGSVAMMKVEELLESMRANPSALAAYAAAGTGDKGKNCSTGTIACSPDELAVDDIFWWNQNLTAGLPLVATTTTLIEHIPPALTSNMATVTITVNWNERDPDAATVAGVVRSYAATASICVAVPC